jgi:hypothetical protein
MSTAALITERDTLRQERGRVGLELSEVEGELDSLREAIIKSTRQIKTMEQHLNRVGGCMYIRTYVSMVSADYIITQSPNN